MLLTCRGEGKGKENGACHVCLCSVGIPQVDDVGKLELEDGDFEMLKEELREQVREERHCSLFAVHCTVCGVHCALFPVLYSLCTVHCSWLGLVLRQARLTMLGWAYVCSK